MIKSNIVLIGFMGAGKTLASKQLGKLLKKTVKSTDQEIEKREQAKIPDIFQTKGESHFRQVERQVVAKLAGLKGVIIDCGGGVVTNPDNIRDLKENGEIFYLKASVETLHKNILQTKQTRPLLNVPDPKAKIQALLSAREALYKQADHTINANQSIEGICQEILEVYHEQR